MLRIAIKKQFGDRPEMQRRSNNRKDDRIRRTFTLEVDITMPDGVTIIFGPSGSGKTTCLQCIAGIVTPDEGQISLGERVFFDAASGVNLPVQQRRVGFMFQDYVLFPHLTAEQNVIYGIRDGASKANKRERARELLSRLGLAYAARQYPHELSGARVSASHWRAR